MSESKGTSAEKSFRAGDKVSWESSGGTARGQVVRKLTKPMEIKGHHVAASKDNPEYLVETEEGARAAHKPSALKKRGGSASKDSALKKGSGSASKDSALKKRGGSASKDSAPTRAKG